jgi:hypothetical protein
MYRLIDRSDNASTALTHLDLLLGNERKSSVSWHASRGEPAVLGAGRGDLFTASRSSSSLTYSHPICTAASSATSSAKSLYVRADGRNSLYPLPRARFLLPSHATPGSLCFSRFWLGIRLRSCRAKTTRSECRVPAFAPLPFVQYVLLRDL